MLKLHTLPADPGKSQSRKRIGRGEGSGQGKTAGKGHKGQQARSGSGKGAAFEGGQMPFVRRIPKFGFTNRRFRAVRGEISLSDLNRFEDGATVAPETFVAAGLVPRKAQQIRVLANGSVERKLTVKAHGFTARARLAIEAAGGQCEVVS